MAAVFPTFASVGPVGAVTPALSANFRSSYAVTNEPNFQRTQQKVMAIVNMILSVKQGAIAGVYDYTIAGGHGKLIADAAAFTGGLSNFNINDALDTLCVVAGQVSGQGAFTTNMATILATGQDFASLPEQTLDRILALLLYKQYL